MKHGEFLVGFCLDFYSTAQQLDDVRDNLVLENAVVVGFQAIQNLSSNRNDCLKLCISCHLNRTQRRIALHNIEFPSGNVLAPAVYKLLYPIHQVDVAG